MPPICYTPWGAKFKWTNMPPSWNSLPWKYTSLECSLVNMRQSFLLLYLLTFSCKQNSLPEMSTGKWIAIQLTRHQHHQQQQLPLMQPGQHSTLLLSLQAQTSSQMPARITNHELDRRMSYIKWHRPNHCRSMIPLWSSPPLNDAAVIITATKESRPAKQRLVKPQSFLNVIFHFQFSIVCILL